MFRRKIIKIVTIIGARPQFIKAGSVSREISKYKEVQEIMTEDMGMLYLAETSRMVATREDIEGWILDPDPLLKYWPLYRTE